MKIEDLIYKTLIVFSFLSYSIYANGNGIENITQTDTVVINLRDFGLERMRKNDCTKIINKALKDVDDSSPTVIRFPRGEYHFYASEGKIQTYNLSNSSDKDSRRCAIVLENRNNLIIDGNGSKLIFHNQIQPFTIDNCTNISIRNIAIDWEQPLTAQAKITKVNDEFIELAIDLKEYPYRLENGKLFFTIDGNVNKSWKFSTEIDAKIRHIVPQTGEMEPLGNEWENYIAEDIIPGVIRLYYPFSRKPKTGNILVLQYAEQNNPGIFIEDSKNITISNVNIFHAPGVGILAKNSENLDFNNYKSIPNKVNSRYYSSDKGGLYILNGKGEIKINNCEFDGTMNNAITIWKDKQQNENQPPNITITNSHFKCSRGCGILLSPAINALIQNNVFESSGSAILFSGGNINSGSENETNILIENNEFTELCNSGIYKFNEGIISIYPEIQPINETTNQIYRNIKIANNRFNPFDYSVLYARLVNGLTFENNSIVKSSEYEPFHNRHFVFTFEGCKNILINNNTISEDVLGKNIQLKWMDESELHSIQPELEIR